MRIDWTHEIAQDLIRQGKIQKPAQTSQNWRESTSVLPAPLTPQQVLFEALRLEYGGEVVLPNWQGLLPARKLDIDIYFADQHWGIEVQSLAEHSSLAALHRDCEKSQLYALIGVHITYVMSGHIIQALYDVLGWVAQMRTRRQIA